MEKFKNNIYYLLFLFIGLVIYFYPMFTSGFDLIPGDGIKIKYSGYLLEHSFLWLNQAPLHESFWSAPFGYPDTINSIALDDVLIGIMPIYWILRTFLSPFSSIQWLFIILSIINYSTFYYFLRQIKFSYLASCLGAFIFAFSLMRYFKIFDIGCFSQFYTILAIIFLLKPNKNNKPLINHMWFLMYSISMILQFYTNFAFGFFDILIGAGAIFLFLLPKTGREYTIEYFKNHYKLFLFYSFVIVLMLMPLFYYYVSVERILELKGILLNIKSPLVWIRNVSIADNLFFYNLPYIGSLRYHAMSISAGIFTMLLALFGIWKLKYSKGVPIILLVLIFFISCSNSAIETAKILYLIPGGEYIKLYSNIAFLALIIFSIGIASLMKYFEEIDTKKGIFLIIISALIIILEQVPYLKDPNSGWENYNLSKKEFIKDINYQVKKINQNCNVISFEYLPYNKEPFGKKDIIYKEQKKLLLENLFGMWLSLYSGKYSANNYLKPDSKNTYNAQCIIREKINFNDI